MVEVPSGEGKPEWSQACIRRSRWFKSVHDGTNVISHNGEIKLIDELLLCLEVHEERTFCDTRLSGNGRGGHIGKAIAGKEVECCIKESGPFVNDFVSRTRRGC